LNHKLLQIKAGTTGQSFQMNLLVMGIPAGYPSLPFPRRFHIKTAPLQGRKMIEKFTLSKGNQVGLKEFDPEDTGELSKKDIKKEYAELQETFIKFQEKFYASKKYALLVILQGMDCSGKDGTVKKVLSDLNPNGISVESFKVPTPAEIGHDYLWRIHKETPMKGDIVVFNRSYYEDVLVTRVHKTIDDDTAFKRFKEINEFEKYLIHNQCQQLKD
jgi:polyphosphate kinase 2 (PPK2 family)